MLGLSLYAAWPGDRGSKWAPEAGEDPSVPGLYADKLGSRAEAHSIKARSGGSRGWGMGQNDLDNCQAYPTGTLSLALQPVLVPVSQVARDKLRLQRGTPLPGREFGLGGPTAHPTCNQKPRHRAAEGGEALDSTVGPTAGAGLVSQGSLKGWALPCLSPLRAALPCRAPVSSLPPLGKVSPGIQGSWSGGPTGSWASATPQPHAPASGNP